MTARKWIIEARARTCSNSRCNHYGEKGGGNKTTINAEGLITTVCGMCKQSSATQARDYKETRACIGCKHVRNITVHIYSNGELQARDLCDACEMETSARIHIQTAERLHAKAAAIRAQRSASKTTRHAFISKRGQSPLEDVPDELETRVDPPNELSWNALRKKIKSEVK